jgi:hypothetical protein
MPPDLTTQIEDTLPPYVEGRDRRFHFESDGTLVYEREEGDWEPPRAIDGFEIDPDDPWRLRSLWSPCEARLHTAVRFPACGCIGLISRCSEPRGRFMQRVTFEVCKQCPLGSPANV